MLSRRLNDMYFNFNLFNYQNKLGILYVVHSQYWTKILQFLIKPLKNTFQGVLIDIFFTIIRNQIKRCIICNVVLFIHLNKNDTRSKKKLKMSVKLFIFH